MTRRQKAGVTMLALPLLAIVIAMGLYIGIRIILLNVAFVTVGMALIMTAFTLLDDRDMEDSSYGPVRLLAVPVAIVRWYRILREEKATNSRRGCFNEAWRNAWGNVR